MDSKKLTQTIGKMEDALDRIHRRKSKEKEEAIEKNEEIEKNGGTESDFVPVPKAWSDRTVETYKGSRQPNDIKPTLRHFLEGKKPIFPR
ncbi:hypothetical protein bcgnr5380_55710 [Bacillus cereus]